MALHELVDMVGTGSEALAVMAQDRSADVRQLWAEAMQEKQWP